MYFNGVETQELCIKLDAEPSRGMSTDSSLCLLRRRMRDAIPEPRTAVMILAEASWEDQNGILRRERARMENTSDSGACIRVKKQINVGTKLRCSDAGKNFQE
jgi:hypothetical protein